MLYVPSPRRLLLVLCAVSLPVAGTADVKVVSKLSVTGQGSPSSRTVTTYFKGDRTRTEMDGTVQILDNKAKMLYVIDPKAKTYRATDLRNIGATIQGLREIKFSSTAKVKPTNERKTIAGKPSRKYIGSATVTMSFGKNPGMTTQIEVEQWTTESVKGAGSYQQFMGGLGPLGNMQFLSGMSPVIKEFGKMKGLPLSSRMTMSSQMGGSAGRNKVTTINEVQSVSEGNFAAGLFTVPKGYKKITAAVRPGPRKDDGHGH